MRIYHNVSSLRAANRLQKTNKAKESNLEKLSSGLRINRAADDAAGLAISERMRSQQRGMEQATRNAQDAKSMVATAEGAMEEIGSILQRVRELSIQAANGTNNTSEREKIKDEMVGLHSEVNRIANSTKFNGKSLINGGGTTLGSANIEGAASIDSVKVAGDLEGADLVFTSDGGGAGELTAELQDGSGNTLSSQTIYTGSDTFSGEINFDQLGVTVETNGASLDTDFSAGVTDSVAASGGTYVADIQIGANAGETISVGMDNVTTGALGITLADLDIATGDEAVDTAAINALSDSLDDALSSISSSRAKLGTTSNRLDFAMNNLQTSYENLTEAESRIRDVDMAKEMVQFTKNNILAQAGNSMLAQSNQMPQSVLKLLG